MVEGDGLEGAYSEQWISIQEAHQLVKKGQSDKSEKSFQDRANRRRSK